MALMTKTKTAEFKLYAPQARRVSIAGSFNKWDTKALSAKRDSKGNWMVKVNLKPGRHEYKFFVDGSWLNDPRASMCVPNAFGTQNCVIEIK
jgi:1,4-alpha-glucan branching enzyme